MCPVSSPLEDITQLGSALAMGGEKEKHVSLAGTEEHLSSETGGL